MNSMGNLMAPCLKDTKLTVTEGWESSSVAEHLAGLHKTPTFNPQCSFSKRYWFRFVLRQVEGLKRGDTFETLVTNERK